MEFLCFLGGNGKKTVHLSNPSASFEPQFGSKFSILSLESPILS